MVSPSLSFVLLRRRTCLGRHRYVAHRLRRPRGYAGGDRGAELVITRDGVEVWRVRKQELGAASIERGALLHDADGRWKLFLSFAADDDGKWRVVELAAPTVEALKPSDATVLFTAEDCGAECVVVVVHATRCLSRLPR